jgi:hypothetical protein
MIESDADERSRRASDRRRRSILRYPERRTGFDRREGGPGFRRATDRILMGLDRSSFGLAAVLVLTNVLNITDLALTFRLLGKGAEEANPIMLGVLGLGPVAAFVIKVAALGLVTLAIWKMRRYRSILALSLVALGAFVVLIGYELILISNVA